MPVVSVTRFRARSLRFLPFFALHTNRTIAQIRKADGFIGGAVCRDPEFGFWTMTVWRDERALQAYVASGAHRRAMPHLRDWGEEAGVVRWTQDSADLPDWSVAAHRLREQGRASALRYPGPNHAGRNAAEPRSNYGMRL